MNKMYSGEESLTTLNFLNLEAEDEFLSLSKQENLLFKAQSH